MKLPTGRVPRPRPWFIRLLRIVLKPILIRQYRISSRFSFDIRDLNPPYIVVANHVNFWDPFLINLFIPHPIQYVTSDNIFRTRFFGFVMKLVGSIPKTKFKRDIDAVRNIFAVLSGGGVIGIFPEARRSWTGVSLPTMYEVSRLLRKIKLPVVAAVIKGGYLSKPRWAAERRKGKVLIDYSMILERDDEAYADVDDLHSRIQAAVENDDVEYAKSSNTPFICEHLAEYLERVLFICPGCESLSTLISEGSAVRCVQCGYAAEYDAYGELTYPGGTGPLASVSAWDQWQLGVLDSIVDTACDHNRAEPIFAPEPATVYTCKRTEKMVPLADGNVSLTSQGISLRRSDGHEMVYAIGEVQGINVQNGEMLEFYNGPEIIRIDLHGERSCAYKWFRAIYQMRRISEGDEIT